MKLYSARVRIGGSRDHEVNKTNLTAPEMKLLERLHVSPQGHPVLVDVKHTGDVNRSDTKERARLAAEYSHGELVEERGKKLIESMFGLAGGMPLPEEYVPDVPVQKEEFTYEDDEEEVIVPVAEAKRTDIRPLRSRQKIEDAVV